VADSQWRSGAKARKENGNWTLDDAQTGGNSVRTIGGRVRSGVVELSCITTVTVLT
jgi:hypothetical protein